MLVTGTEGLLADRALERLRRRAREAGADLEVVAVDAALYESGQLATWTSPSLFGEPRLVLVEGVEQASEAFLADAAGYLDDVQPDVVLALRHAGGQRGRALLEAIRACPQAVVVDCPPLKKDAEKHDLVAAEFRDAGRRATPHAVRAIVEAVGSDLRELAAGCAQLVADVPPGRDIDVEDVDRYYGGRAEVTGFKVADAVVAGQRERALMLVRQAIDVGVDPIPMLAVMAVKLRTMVKVGAARGGRPADLAKELGMPPWQVDRARKELRGWTPEGLAAGLVALAEADVAVKGGGRDAVYAVERAVMTITAARS
ncbi:MAG: DNA polymerase III subunit delta [Actinomycetota bacterium]